MLDFSIELFLKVFSVLLMALGAWHRFVIYKTEKSGITTNAKIIKKIWGSKRKRLEVEILDKDGNVAKSLLAVSHKTYNDVSEGESIPVVYDSQNPKRCHHKSTVTISNGFLIFSIVFCLFIFWMH